MFLFSLILSSFINSVSLLAYESLSVPSLHRHSPIVRARAILHSKSYVTNRKDVIKYMAELEDTPNFTNCTQFRLQLVWSNLDVQETHQQTLQLLYTILQTRQSNRVEVGMEEELAGKYQRIRKRRKYERMKRDPSKRQNCKALIVTIFTIHVDTRDKRVTTKCVPHSRLWLKINVCDIRVI